MKVQKLGPMRVLVLLMGVCGLMFIFPFHAIAEKAITIGAVQPLTG